jgi:hypothetical protein
LLLARDKRLLDPNVYCQVFHIENSGECIMSEGKVTLLTYLLRSRVFKMAYDHIPSFKNDWAFLFGDVPFTNCAYRDCMKAAHDEICKVWEARESTLPLSWGVPRDIVYSPTALDYILKNPAEMAFCILDKWSLQYVLSLAGRRGDGKDSPHHISMYQNAVNRVQR